MAAPEEKATSDYQGRIVGRSPAELKSLEALPILPPAERQWHARGVMDAEDSYFWQWTGDGA